MNLQYLLNASNSLTLYGVKSSNVIYFVQGDRVDYFRPIVTTTRTSVSVEAPYNTGFIKRAYELGGVYDNKQWRFSYRDEIDVRKACEESFGYDGLTDPIKTDIRITFINTVYSKPNKSIDILSRPIARVSPRRDTDPLIAPGTLIKAGNIKTQGDKVICEEGTELILREVPMSLFKNHKPNANYNAEITDVDEQAVEMLFYEHDQLVERFAEVKMLLASADKDINQFLSEARDRHEPKEMQL